MNPNEPTSDQQPQAKDQPQITSVTPTTGSTGFTPSMPPVQNTQLSHDSSSKKKLIILVAIVSLLVLGAVAFVLVNNKNSKTNNSATLNTANTADKKQTESTNGDEPESQNVTGTQYDRVQQKARDTHRITDIHSLHAKLEEHYANNNGYPSTFTAATFRGIAAETLLDPDNQPINIYKPVADQSTAQAIANPNADGPNYSYVAFPANCTKFCTGYVLKTYIELSDERYTNPYVKLGLNNP